MANRQRKLPGSHAAGFTRRRCGRNPAAHAAGFSRRRVHTPPVWPKPGSSRCRFATRQLTLPVRHPALQYLRGTARRHPAISVTRGHPSMRRLLCAFVVLAILSGPAAAQVKVTSLGVNTAADEDDPHVSTNGLTLYYTATTKKKSDIMMLAPPRPHPRLAGRQADGRLHFDRDRRPQRLRHTRRPLSAVSLLRDQKGQDEQQFRHLRRRPPGSEQRLQLSDAGANRVHRPGRAASLADGGRQDPVLQPQDQGGLASLRWPRARRPPAGPALASRPWSRNCPKGSITPH